MLTDCENGEEVLAGDREEGMYAVVLWENKSLNGLEKCGRNAGKL